MTTFISLSEEKLKAVLKEYYESKGEIVNSIFLTNDDPSPMSFVLNPKQQLKVQRESRNKECNEIIIVHSHPKGPSRLSSSDRDMAYEKTKLWFLVSHSNVESSNIIFQCWRVESGGANIEEVSIEIID
jgi:proteasome lid subunit RPN8/RPN11